MTTTSTELCHLTVEEEGDLIKGCKLSPVELTRAYLDRIKRLDGAVHAFHRLAPTAMADARAAEAEIMAGYYKGPLHGMSFAVKDQLDAAGVPSEMRAPTDKLHNRRWDGHRAAEERGGHLSGQTVDERHASGAGRAAQSLEPGARPGR